MKYPLHILLFITGSLFAQNLVPNGSFEDTVNCPNSSCEIGYTKYWLAFGTCPDYYNACVGGQGWLSVPSNMNGYQYAADGIAYIGMDMYAVRDTSKKCYYRDVAGVHLSSPMVVTKILCFVKSGIKNR